jgi:hypothetical protein
MADVHWPVPVGEHPRNSVDHLFSMSHDMNETFRNKFLEKNTTPVNISLYFLYMDYVGI